MDIEDIKRGLRAEIKKRENEQYATFECNVRQMCKDVLAKLEEQELKIVDKGKVIVRLKIELCEAKALYWCAVQYNCIDAESKRRAARRQWKYIQLSLKYRKVINEEQHL